MSPKIKLVLYVVLATSLAVFGHKAFSIHRLATSAPLLTVPNPATNADESTNAPASTNASTNSSAASTNGVSGTNETSLTNQTAPTNAISGSSEDLTPRRASARLSGAMAYGAAALLSLVGLAILISQDVSRFVANRFEEFVFNDNLEGARDPEYDEAEEVWKKGEHLEAIRLMREYLKRHPREQYVALRIAEIYETDLRNYLAAALEYEEILKKKLPPERWGWAAIHLANLYSGKLNKASEAEALLRRIINEYGQTAAAKKARERLGVPEPQIASTASFIPAEPKESKQPEPADSNLPPGFRPKK
jgi:TolA-binding protein